ncbi:GEM-interacting protein isoform X2 [Amia ocellicauda]|uniref:GEM-interacting protein isoform X2 n=1 Tax=Amia ocellicauda TaxID=2972642 RepID=UPI0034645BC1
MSSCSNERKSGSLADLAAPRSGAALLRLGCDSDPGPDPAATRPLAFPVAADPRCFSHDLSRIAGRLRRVVDDLQQLRDLFTDSAELPRPSQRQVDLKLQDLQDSLQQLSDRHPVSHSPAVCRALAALTNSLADTHCVPRTKETKRYSEIFREFDALELSIGANVVESLMDPETQSLAETVSSEAGDLDGLQSDEAYTLECHTDDSEKNDALSAQEADMALLHCEEGVEIALQYAKMWCRYAKDILGWMDKRFGLEQEFSKNIIKAAEAAKSSVTQQDLMPLQYIYTMALEHDVKCSISARQTADLLQTRCYQALYAKRNEIEKWRREFKEQWVREQKKMSDGVAALKKARQQYNQRFEDLEKARALSARAEEESGGGPGGGTSGSATKTLEKRRRSRDEAQAKVQEAESYYKHCITDAVSRQGELDRVKERIIIHTRKLICQGDTVLKETTINLFHYQRQQTEPVPLGYHNLEVTCRPSEPGETYLRYIFKRRKREQVRETFEFIAAGKKSPPAGRRKTSNPPMGDSNPLPEETTSKRSSIGPDSTGRNSRCAKPGYSDTDSLGGSTESPPSSPAHIPRLPKASSTGTMSSEDLEDKDLGQLYEGDTGDPLGDSIGSLGSGCKIRSQSRASQMHRLRKMRNKMARCRQCENYILVNGIECEECSLTVHRKCLDMCQLECEQRKGNVFGVNFSLVPRGFPEEVPFVVRRCTAEIESRALGVQGVYRVSGSKPRIQKLCQAFETQPDEVDLSDHSPHDITSLLKHFFKELPEPVVIFDLYNDFINMGKEIQRLSEKEFTAETSGIVEDFVQSLRILLGRLPVSNYNTLRHVIAHLYRVSEQYEENKMSPGNLGIVFGPTLVRPLVSGDVSMVALLETSYQAMLVEFLITHYERLFGLDDLPRSSPVLTAAPEVESRESEEPPLEAAPISQERPCSLENLAMKRDSSEGYISDKSSSNEAVDQLSPEANDRAGLDSTMSETGLPREQAVDSEQAPGTQPRGHFSRMPVKYQRQATPMVKSRTAVLMGELGIQDRERGSPPCRARPGSADSSRSSSPDPGTLRGARRRLEITPETARLLSKAGQTSEGGLISSLSSPNLLQSMNHPQEMGSANGLSNQRTRPGSGIQEAVPPSEQVEELAKLNSNQSNNNGVGRARLLDRGTLSFKRPPGEQRTAQKILSGLKLRRSDSERGSQVHFV